MNLQFSAKELGAVLEISERRVRQLADEGVILRGDTRGRYRLVPSVANYVATQKRADEVGLDDLRRERLLKLRMDNAVREKTLIAMDEAEACFGELCGLFVSALSGLPAQITSNIGERRRIQEITDQIRQRLTDKLKARWRMIGVEDAEIDDD